ncbi:CRAL/TRIO domain-containing protein [Mollisia scopiformis]|uniref:CRAL/TRIO domain-containing protein n=1 Tax=Mollisia scopiformis TaxID=149040 RepID=A0A194XPH5_MOLSC|nr:CRAL/TRIO domain-containing protein [Mollisia scopiformis]KUJ22066.1 CRAL/TRIO domain-containing protein [Mollisia scopiformis]
MACMTSNTSSVAASLREKLPGPLKTPIVDPVESAVPPRPVELTAEQKSKYQSLLEIVKSWKEVPSTQGKGGLITESEIMWLTRECLLRYLRATKWVTAEAAKRLLGTLTWRREYGVEDLTGDHISPENETGKQIIIGYDIAARPCHYLNPGRQNTEPSPRQVQHLVFMVERVINLMVPGQETLALLINFKSSKSRSNTAPGLGQGREVLNILQTHYPERLGRALIINIPWIVNGFFKLITPFIDPLTRQKLKFNDDMRQHVPPEQLWNEFHGDLEFEYEHDVYWPALLRLCEEKHSELVSRWVKAGKNYGESEIYLKGGDEPKQVKSEANGSPAEPASTEAKTPVQTSGTQSNGNMDVMAIKPDPIITTEGDRT